MTRPADENGVPKIEIQIRRKYLYLGSIADVWVHEDITAIVWEYRNEVAKVTAAAIPEHYAPGLFEGFVDNTRVPVNVLDAALKAIGWSRDQIRTLVEDREAGR